MTPTTIALRSYMNTDLEDTMEIRVKIEILNDAGVVVQDATLLADVVGRPDWARPEDGFLGDVETEALQLIDAALEQGAR